MHGDDWFTLAELTTRLGGLVWAEEQLAHVLGDWSKIEGHAPTAISFATIGRHHRWHSEIVRGCLPTSPKLLDPEPVAAPTGGWSQAMLTLASLNDPDATVARLKSMVKVINPWIEREVASLVDLSRPISDAAIMRWLRFASIDHHDDGQMLVELLASRGNDAVRFDDHLVVSELDLT